MRKQFFILLGLAATLDSCSTYNYHAVQNKPLTSNYQSFASLPESKSKASKVYDNNSTPRDSAKRSKRTEVDTY